MPLESTIICVDNSEFMRNGDYIPNRMQAQQDAVNTVCRSKLLANPENNVGLMTLANTEVLSTLTTDGGKILTSLHKVQPNGLINFLTGIKTAHLALKHRPSKNHKTRIVVFVGSPIGTEEKDAVKSAKRLKKENVNVDVISFGETDENQTVLECFVNTINGREGTGSHLVTIPPSPHLSDALLSSPIIQGEDGAGPSQLSSGGGYEFGVDPNEDPELALALRVSMEEQRARQQNEERRTTEGGEEKAEVPMETSNQSDETKSLKSDQPAAAPVVAPQGAAGLTEEEMLQQALAMSMDPSSASEGATQKSSKPAAASVPEFSAMTEEEQIAYAMQISLQADEPMEVDDSKKVDVASKKEAEQPVVSKDEGEESEPDFSEVMSDPSFLENVLHSLPGVDPNSQVVRQAVGNLTNAQKEKKKESEKNKGSDNKDSSKKKDSKDQKK